MQRETESKKTSTSTHQTQTQSNLIMYRTLSDLRNRINQLIEKQGEDAPCAAFVFTKEDVFVSNYEGGDIVEEYLNDDDTDEVLVEVGECDYIYEQVCEIIDDEVARLKIKQSIKK